MIEIQEQNQNIDNTQDEIITHLDSKLLCCGAPTLLCVDAITKSEFGLHRTCKLNHLCAYCARKFQSSFVIDCAKIADYAHQNNKTLVFATLTKKPVPECLLKEGIQEIKDNFFDFRRTRIGKETRQEIFNHGHKKYCDSVEAKKQLVCEKERYELDLSVGRQKYYYSLMDEFLDTIEQPRISKMIARGVGRYEFKSQPENEKIYIHVHMLLALHCPIPQNFLAESWLRASDCGVVDITPIPKEDYAKVACYIGKYMGKAEGSEIDDFDAWIVQKAITQKKENKFSAYRQKFWIGSEKLVKNAKKLSQNIPVAFFDKGFDGEKVDGENIVGKIYKTRKIASFDVFHYEVTGIEKDVTMRKLKKDKKGNHILFTRCDDSTITKNHRIEFWRTGKYSLRILDANLEELVYDAIPCQVNFVGISSRFPMKIVRSLPIVKNHHCQITEHLESNIQGNFISQNNHVPTVKKTTEFHHDNIIDARTHLEILLTTKQRKRIAMITQDRKNDHNEFLRSELLSKIDRKKVNEKFYTIQFRKLRKAGLI